MIKRRDIKGRILRDGENQRKDGRYEYKYTDKRGERHSIYSWRLVENDPLPAGKKKCEALRTLEATIRRDAEDDIDTYSASQLTFEQCFNDFIDTKRYLKPTSIDQYKQYYTSQIKDTLGKSKICDIKYSTIKKFYIHLLLDKGLKITTVSNVHRLIFSVFKLAVRDGYLRMNPADGVFAEVKKPGYGASVSKKRGLQVDDQEIFLKFVSESNTFKHWRNLFIVFLGTGLRIGELTALRWCDCDFVNNEIHIDHALVYYKQDDGKCDFRIQSPKSEAGNRTIPMMQAVKDALLAERAEQSVSGSNHDVIDGYSGFIFRNRNGSVISIPSVNLALKRIVDRYNKEETESAKQENREPHLLPHCTAHTFRHTFCTRLCQHDVNIKVIQGTMGHASIQMTLDVYTDVSKENTKANFAELEKKYKIV